MVANMIILGLLQICTIYAATFQQFLAVRSLFGLFMGGVYGNAIAMALENAPVDVSIPPANRFFGHAYHPIPPCPLYDLRLSI